MRKAVLNLGKYKLVLLLTAVIFLAGCGQQKLHTVKIEAEANQIIDMLNENGIRATKGEEGEGERKSFVIYVGGDEQMLASALQLMEDHCLGRPEPPQVEGGTMITSIEVERAREQRRSKMNIESQLRKINGVTCAEVNFVMPEDRSLAIKPYPSTASVLVNYKTPTFSVSKEDIAALVARSVPALQPENVTVILDAKPLRPLPDNKIGYNLTRLALISGVGLLTILGFVSVIFVLRKKRRNPTQDAEAQAGEDFENDRRNSALLNDKYDFDEDVDLP